MRKQEMKEVNNMKLKEKEQLLEKITELQKQVEKLEVEKENPFDVKDTEKAYYNSSKYMYSYDRYWDDEDIYDYVPCKDKSIVDARQKRHHLNDLLEKFAYENNANVTDEMWENEYKDKYVILYDYWLKNYQPRATVIKNIGTIYFTTKKIAQRAIDEIVLPFMEEKEND